MNYIFLPGGWFFFHFHLGEFWFDYIKVGNGPFFITVYLPSQYALNPWALTAISVVKCSENTDLVLVANGSKMDPVNLKTYMELIVRAIDILPNKVERALKIILSSSQALYKHAHTYAHTHIYMSLLHIN